MKRFFAIMLAALMLLTACALPAFADEEQKGTITINGVSDAPVYKIYRMLDLDYGADNNAFTYTVNSAWAGFFAEGTGAFDYMYVDAQGYVTWTAADDDVTKAAFASLALDYAEANGIAPTTSSENDGEFVITGTSGVFSDLELGYYLVDSTIGVLCGLTNTAYNGVVNAKNGIPLITKTVQEDSTSAFGDKNTADIGQTVDFNITVNVHAGAQDYIIHDKMADGLTFKQIVSITHINPDANDQHPMEEGTHYTLATDGECTFEIILTDAAMADLEENDKIVVLYNAMLNRNAVVAGDGNLNQAWVTYGEGSMHETEKAETKTYTYGFDLLKTDMSNNFIDGAEFKIYDAAAGGNEIAVVLMDDGVTYRRARADETGVSIVVTDGQVRLVGFDNGVYYLEETVAPVGFNKLSTRHKFTIADANLDAIFTNGAYSVGSGVHVQNKTGTVLPETGGMGTVIFVLVGGLMVVATGVILVSKKRMSKLGG